MAKSNLKVIDIRDYLKSQPWLDQDRVEGIITAQRLNLRQLDVDVIDLLSIKHRLKDIQKRKETSVGIERNLIHISDWLEDKVTQSSQDEAKAKWQTLFKQCEQLISRNERVKKNISDDISACRYVALDPIKVVGFIIGMPLTLATLVRTFISNDPAAMWKGGAIGLVTGFFWAFHRELKDISVSGGKALVQSPQRINGLKKNFRNRAFNAALTVSMAVVEANGIEPNYPNRSSLRHIITITARR